MNSVPLDLQVLCDAPLEDLLLQEFVCEEKGGLEYHPMLRTMFLKVGAQQGYRLFEEVETLHGAVDLGVLQEIDALARAR